MLIAPIHPLRGSSGHLSGIGSRLTDGATLAGKLLGRLARHSANRTSGLPSVAQPGPDQGHWPQL